jgi:hypothetical protein
LDFRTQRPGDAALVILRNSGYAEPVPILLLLFAVLGVLLVVILTMPVSLVMRYRAGRARREARGWVASLNIMALALSVVLWLTATALTSLWVPGSLTYAFAGLGIGGLLGVVGLMLTRWDATPGRLHFTPNAWIVLFVTVVVAARIAYGVWRTWHAWEAGFDHTSSIVVDGVRGSLAAAGVVLGYYLIFWLGVLRQARRQPVHKT